MHDQKDPYGNPWINPPAAPAAPPAEAREVPGVTGEVLAEALAAHERNAAGYPPPAVTDAHTAALVEPGELDGSGRWVPAGEGAFLPAERPPPLPRSAQHAAHAQNPEASQWGWRWAWLGFDSRDGRLLAGDTAPLTSGAVKFGEVRELWVRPMRPFKGRHLWVHSSIARSFLIHSVRVGNQLAGIANQPIPADMFAVDYGDIAALTIHDVEPGKLVSIEVHKAPADMPRGPVGWRGIPFDLPAAQVGMEIGIIVENIERTVYEPLRFLGAFLGETPER